MDSTFVTDADKVGMLHAAEERFQQETGRQPTIRSGAVSSLESLEDLLKRDKEREKDGFSSKIKFRRVLAGPGKVIVVPFVEDGKLVHGEFEPPNIVGFSPVAADGEEGPDIDESIGNGEGAVGDIVGRRPIGGGIGEGDEPGEAGDESGEHGFEEEAFETGRKLTENLALPNLKEKVKKVPTDEYTYELTDRHQGSGQLLDRQATLRRIAKTNLVLGRVSREHMDPKKMLVAPADKVYRVLSRQRVWKAQAIVFFVRDYSGSMWGGPTKSVVAQHLMIYAWLSVVYEKRVIPRFIVHDTQAREVTARNYFGESAGGGTMIASAYKKINEIVEGESLESSYNIYVFQGTDGDDFDDGTQALPEIRKMLGYVNRMGVTLFKSPYYAVAAGADSERKTAFERYVEKGGILTRRDVFRMHAMSGYNVTEEMNVEALKALIAQD